MKRTYFKIFIAAAFFQSNILLAEVNVGASNQQSNQNLKPEDCKEENATVDDNGKPVPSEKYTNCLYHNRLMQSARNYGAGATGLVNLALTITVEPKPNCDQNANTGGGEEGGNYSYQLCMQQFNNSNEKKAWDIKKSVAASESTASANPNIAKLEDKTATGSMDEIQKKNEDGQMLYKVAGVAMAGAAAYCFSTASVCAAPSWGSCVPGLVAAGAAYLLLSAKSNQQASEHAQAANEACNTYNQLSSEQKDCSAGGGGGGGAVTTPPITSIYSPTGECLPTAPPGCKPITTVTTGGGKFPTNCKDAAGKAISCLAAGQAYYKQNPNGSVTVKTGKGDKTYTSADFADKKSMMAAGMSAADADKLVNDLYGKNGALAKAGLDAKSMALGNDGDKKYGDFTSGASTGAVVVDSSKDAHKKFGDKLGDSVADRRPSSEGLSRDFNGDLIGAAGDDIFSMMKRRYNLKNEQDSFIAP